MRSLRRGGALSLLKGRGRMGIKRIFKKQLVGVGGKRIIFSFNILPLVKKLYKKITSRV